MDLHTIKLLGYSDTVRSSALTVTLFCRPNTVTVSGEACTIHPIIHPMVVILAQHPSPIYTYTIGITPPPSPFLFPSFPSGANSITAPPHSSFFSNFYTVVPSISLERRRDKRTEPRYISAKKPCTSGRTYMAWMCWRQGRFLHASDKCYSHVVIFHQWHDRPGGVVVFPLQKTAQRL